MKLLIIFLLFVSMKLFPYNNDLNVEEKHKDNNTYIYVTNKMLVYNAIGVSLSISNIELKAEVMPISSPPPYSLGLNLYLDKSTSHDYGISVMVLFGKNFTPTNNCV